MPSMGQNDKLSEAMDREISGGGMSDSTREVQQRPNDATSKTRDLSSHLLDFLSHATNETLGVCFLGLGISTYFILGRVGLVLIGVVVGILLHATYDGTRLNQADGQDRSPEARKRREQSLDIIHRVLDWRETSAETTVENTDIADDTSLSQSKGSDFAGFQEDTRKALQTFTNAIIRDYVKWWYGPLLPGDTSFPATCERTLTRFLLAISNQLARKRPADVFLNFLTNASSIVIVFLSELATAMRDTSGLENSEKVYQYVEQHPSSSLANVLDRDQQEKKLHDVANDILQSFLEPRSYNCEPVRRFLQEVLAKLVLDMTVDSCSRPEFINEWIIFALEDGETTELVQAIDAGVSGATADRQASTSQKSASSREAVEVGVNGQNIVSDLPTAGPRSSTNQAEDAMEEAMREAKRLSELIAAEDSNKNQLQHKQASPLSSQQVDSADVPLNGNSNRVVESHDHLAAADYLSHPSQPTVAREEAPHFTTFDQIISSQPTALRGDVSEPGGLAVPARTLHNATVSIFDDSVPGEKSAVKSKPTVEYLLQIEPASSHYSGWMIARKYPDFETLHEVLRRISVISGVTAFTERHQNLPTWKQKSKDNLRVDLEQYLKSALSYQRLAESEGMKRFLEKDQGLNGTSPGTVNKGGFGFPTPATFETMGKGMLDVLSSAPKGVAGGGKAVVGGVTGVFGANRSLGQKKPTPSTPTGPGSHVNGSSTMPSTRSDLVPGPENDWRRQSQEQARSTLESMQLSQKAFREDGRPPALPQRPDSLRDSQQKIDATTSESPFEHQKSLTDGVSKTDAVIDKDQERGFHLPPPPSEISDDYMTLRTSPKITLESHASPGSLPNSVSTQSSNPPENVAAVPVSKPARNSPTPLTEQETSVAVELFFATINELYTLSSAWTLRLTLLNAAKSFLLRPGNPNLESIRQLLQSTLIDANVSDTGVAAHIQKIRENALPTEEELKTWPPPPNTEEKEQRRIKARKMLVEKGMPQALTSVMGAAASGEALGKVFDCLQVPEVARGLVFALILQGVRAITQ